MQEIHSYFVETRGNLADSHPEHRKLDRNLFDGLRQIENELKRREYKDQHKQAIFLGQKTLRWARVGGVAGIAAALIAAIVPIVQTYCTNNQRALPATASPTSLPQDQPTTSELPVPEASANTSLPSPQPTAVEQATTPP